MKSAPRRGVSTDTASTKSPFIGAMTLVIGVAISVLLLYKNGGWSVFRAKHGMGFEEYYLFNAAMLMGPPILSVLYLFRRDLGEFGLQSGDLKGGTIAAIAAAALFVPVLLIIAPRPEFQEYYLWMLTQSGAVHGLSFMGGKPIGGEIDPGRLAFHELTLGYYMLGWEWFFRGFLLFGLRRWMPLWAAALVQAALFCLLHFGKPPIEVASSFLGALVLAGAAIRFRSILPCFLVHMLISMSNDIAVLCAHFR